MSNTRRLARAGLAVAACILRHGRVRPGRLSRPSRSRSSRRCSRAAASTSSRARSASASRKALGQPVVVENQSGGGGIVGSLATARAAPDGYTLMVGYVGTHGTNPAVRKLPYDAIKDFTPIAMVGGTPNVLVVPPSMPGEDAGRVHRLREGEQGQALVRLGRPGHAHAPRDGAAQGRERHSTCSTSPIAASGRRSRTSSAGRRRRCSPASRPRCRRSRPARCARSR